MLQRRHCQQAASNDARRLTAVVVVPSRHRADALSAIDVAGHAMPRNADGPRRFTQMRGSFRRRSRDVRRAKGCVHPGIVKVTGRRQAPGRDLLRSIELQRRVSTATPFGARDGHEGKEPWESVQLNAYERASQQGGTNTPPDHGVFVWNIGPWSCHAVGGRRSTQPLVRSHNC